MLQSLLCFRDSGDFFINKIIMNDTSEFTVDHQGWMRRLACNIKVRPNFNAVRSIRSQISAGRRQPPALSAQLRMWHGAVPQFQPTIILWWWFLNQFTNFIFPEHQNLGIYQQIRSPCSLPGLCPWTPLGNFCPQIPCPVSLAHCKYFTASTRVVQKSDNPVLILR